MSAVCPSSPSFHPPFSPLAKTAKTGSSQYLFHPPFSFSFCVTESGLKLVWLALLQKPQGCNEQCWCVALCCGALWIQSCLLNDQALLTKQNKTVPGSYLLDSPPSLTLCLLLPVCPPQFWPSSHTSLPLHRFFFKPSWHEAPCLFRHYSFATIQCFFASQILPRHTRSAMYLLRSKWMQKHYRQAHINADMTSVNSAVTCV